LSLLLLVASACFAAQAVLPLPGRGNLVAAQALQQLAPFQRVSSVHRITGNVVTVSASCVSHHLIRKSTAAATAGPGFRAWLRGQRSPSVSPPDALPPQLVFKLASCPHSLRAWVGAELDRAHPVAIENVRYHGMPTYRLTFSTRPLLLVYVNRQTLRLVGVNVRAALPSSAVRFSHFD
jgi:hypothetical protein